MNLETAVKAGIEAIRNWKAAPAPANLDVYEIAEMASRAAIYYYVTHKDG